MIQLYFYDVKYNYAYNFLRNLEEIGQKRMLIVCKIAILRFLMLLNITLIYMKKIYKYKYIYINV